MAQQSTGGVAAVEVLRLPERPWYWPLRSIVRTFRTKPLGMAGGLLVLFMALLAVFADAIAPYGYREMVGRGLQPPSLDFLFGTDRLGRDMFSRIIYGARISMFVGLTTVAIAVTFSTIVGTTSAYFGGKVDLVIQRFVDAWMAFPGLIIVLTLVAIFGQGLRNVILAMGLMFIWSESRVTRSAVMAVKENQYVDAARAVGVSTPGILVRHILPNIFAPILVIGTAALGSAILLEASLGFLGFGVPPPFPTWGAMLSGENLRQMEFAPWTAVTPGVALSLAVFGFNMLGDALRDILDPRLRGATSGGFR